MKKLSILSALFFLWSCNSNSEETTTTNNEEMNAPICKINPHTLSKHGEERIDNYYWLNDRENPEVIAYLEAENAYTKAKMSSTENLQKSLYEEIKSRIKEQDESVPYFKNDYYYKTKTIEGGEYPIYVRSKNADFSEEEILLDGNQMAEGLEYFDIGGFEISPNNELMAFAIDTVSRRLYDIQIKNLITGEIYPEVLQYGDGSLAWADDNSTLFYSAQDPETLRSDKVMKHILGTLASQDDLVFFESDETFSTYVFRSKSEEYIMIESYSTLTTETQLLNSADPNGKFTVFHPRTKGLEYSVYHAKGDQFYVLTNKDNATNFQLMTASKSCTKADCWQSLIPHRADVLLEYITIFENYLIVAERSNGLVHLRVIPSNGDEYYVPFNDETYVVYTSGNSEFETTKLRFWYSSLTTPGTTYEFDMNTKAQEILKQQEVVGGYDASEYTSKRLYATARDGVKVPISLVYKNTTELGPNTPLLLYAYGSYGSSEDPYFSNSRISLLDRGFVFAIAHIRGGQELGRPWYEDGKLLKKWNTFNDFIDCTQYLIEEGYTSAKHCYAMGGSAGGLLMGVVSNERPDLYNGIIAQVPFVDVVTTMLDESIPLTTGEYDEWGNPNEKEYYDYMLSYSPYDQVKAQEYTNILITTGLHDSQVQYWEPAKWTAKLRASKTDEKLILLHTNMSAGHGGASGRFEYLKEIALEYAFMFMLEEIEQ
ncbi:MAG: S9 family peptidase [Flavobacteriales bacterium]|nr:S9 family peptidase [Flavobacteriales bacterium]